LSVGGDDDVWARWLEEELGLRRRIQIVWQKAPLRDSEAAWLGEDKHSLRFPAQQLVRDLQAILDAKSCMTRRQWISLLEAVVRVGSVTHVLWLCDVNDRVWRAARGILDGREPPTLNVVRAEIVTHRERFLAYGTPAVPVIRDYASRYLLARLGINLALWHLEEKGRKIGRLSSCEDLTSLFREIATRREALNAVQLRATMETIKEEQARTVACKKGIGSNLVEFGRHVLGQRQTANESLRGYDQGYFLRKRAEYVSAPWIVSLGPVAVLALVHCCLRDSAGPRSVQRLSEHLSWYGLEVDRDDIAKSELGRKLRMLGLVLDSPDAESGMLLVPPFDLGAASTAGTQR
jgi:hypothetical protein